MTAWCLGRIVSTIDASLTHALESDPATLVSWRQAKRITVKPTVVRVVAASASVAPAPNTPAALRETKAA